MDETAMTTVDDAGGNLLARILLVGRLRAWARDWAVGLARGGVWLAAPVAALLGLRSGLAWPAWMILTVWAAGAMLVTAVSVWAGRGWRARYAEQLDCHLDGGDRITNAAEFLENPDGDPFKQMAIREAESWIARAGKPYVSRPWPLDARLIPLALLGLAAMLWIGARG